MRAQLLHLTGPHRGKTILYDETTILIGSATDAIVRYPARGDMKERHAQIEFVEEGCSFYLRAIDGQVFVNRQEVREVILEHGDLVEIGVAGPKFRFRFAESEGSVCKPVRQMLTDAAEVHGESGLWASTHGLRTDLLTQSTFATKVIAIIFATTLFFAAAFLGAALSSSRAARQQEDLSRQRTQQYEAQLRTLGQQVENFRHDQAGHVSREELDTLRVDLARRATIIDTIAEQNTALQRVLDEYSQGVCMIHGTYTFYAEIDKIPAQIADASGAPLEIEYIGTGFLVAQPGQIITNRHVAQPWWKSDDVAPLLAQNLTPKFVSLTATFPGRPPIEIDPAAILLSEDDVDVAIMAINIDEGVPVLPLHDKDLSAMRGQRVILLGYPTGLNALLARAEPNVAQEAIALATDTSTLIAELAKRNIISPVITQGALNEVRPKRLVYDAETTSGGSGGPVFGPDGTVIGVNFAITRDFDGSNFGVPIEFARRLLARQESNETTTEELGARDERGSPEEASEKKEPVVQDGRP